MKLSAAVLSLLLLPLGAIANRKPCGGLKGLPCPTGYKCVDNPNDSCDPKKGGKDCIGYCVKDNVKKPCGGLKGIPCPSGYKCVDNPNDNCDPKNGGADCIGYCVKDNAKKPCGGLKGIPCPSGYKCVDNPNDNCDPKNGGADCIGYCVKKKEVLEAVAVKHQQCGGFQGLTCPQGYKCVDNPDDSCDPNKGDRDCKGHCVKKHTTITKCKHQTICVNRVNKCGSIYGGCYDTCTPTTFKPPPCTTTKKCKHHTLCADYINKCGQTYGGCFDTCTPTTFTAPPCPASTTAAAAALITAAAAEAVDKTKCKHHTICVDRVNECGMKYGGCYDICHPKTFTTPPCPTKTQTAEPAQITYQSCGGFPPPGGARTCSKHQKCVDDPRDGCDPNNGGADCPGVCIPKAFRCKSTVICQSPDNDNCVDDPRDRCTKGIDKGCKGICTQVAPRQTCKGTLLQVMRQGQCRSGYTCVYPHGTPETGCAGCVGVCAEIQR